MKRVLVAGAIAAVLTTGVVAVALSSTRTRSRVRQIRRLIDTKPGNIVGDTIDTGKGTLDWVGPVKAKLAKNKKSGTFSATATAVAVNGKLSGSFTCKRVLDAPDQ
jgi:hypothetical protein